MKTINNFIKIFIDNLYRLYINHIYTLIFITFQILIIGIIKSNGVFNLNIEDSFGYIKNIIVTNPIKKIIFWLCFDGISLFLTGIYYSNNLMKKKNFKDIGKYPYKPLMIFLGCIYEYLIILSNDGLFFKIKWILKILLLFLFPFKKFIFN